MTRSLAGYLFRYLVCALFGASVCMGMAQAKVEGGLLTPDAETLLDSPAEETVSGVATLDVVLQYAYRNNPDLQAARARLYAVHESLPQALAGWRPTIEAQADITDTDLSEGARSSDGSTSQSASLSVTQPLYRGGRTSSETKAARHVIAAQSAALAAVEQAVLLGAATAFMDVVRDRALYDLSKNNRDVIARQLEAVTARFEYGEVTRTDVSQAEARLARAESIVTQSLGDLERSESVYQQIIGIKAESLDQPYLSLNLPRNKEEAAALAEYSNPDVLAAIHAHKAAEMDVDSVYGELLPDIALFGFVDHTRDPSPGLLDKQTTSIFGVQASVPLYRAGATRSRVREAKYVSNQRYVEILAARRAARQQAIENWADLLAARTEIKSREAEVEASRIAREGVRQEEQLGSRTVLDVLDADQEYLDAQVALVTARRDEIIAQFSLLASLGRLTPETLGFEGDAINEQEHLRETIRKIFTMNVDRLGAID